MMQNATKLIILNVHNQLISLNFKCKAWFFF